MGMSDRKDDFWDIAALLPKKRIDLPPPHGEITVPEMTTVDHTSFKEDEDKREARTLHYAASEESGFKKEYDPSDNPFITRVRVIERRSHMRLFHGFKSDGAAWQSSRGTPCPYVPYFSFVPQYEQLNAAQKAYYLYFREEANSGNYLDAGQSYVLLYIFEILNLPEFIPPKIGILRLAKIWGAYRKTMPVLDKNLIPWLADYGLLHGVSCPREILAPFLSEILAKSNLKEFYLGFAENDGCDTTDALILLTSQYRYENGRYATGEHASMFHTHIRQAASAVLRHVFLDGAEIKLRPVTRRFDAFAGALWAGAYRYELEVTYYSVGGTDDLKILMTAAVKYAENKLRAYLAIKSRLAVSCLPDHIRSLIDAYFDRALPPKATKVKEERPEYETMYEPLSVGVTLEDAREIERSSWENTWRLIPEDEREEIFSSVATPTEPDIETAACADNATLTKTQSAFLSFLMAGDQATARRFVKENALSYLTLGEEINEFFVDTLGDVVLELSGEDYTVISDYEEEIRAILA